MSERDGQKRWVYSSKMKTGERQRLKIGIKDTKLLRDVGDIYGRHILLALREEIAKSSRLGRGLPRSKNFVDSFSFEVNDKGDVILNSDWPWVKRYLEGRNAYKMSWLSRQNPRLSGKKVIPLKQSDGTIRFKTLPTTIRGAWVHPAVERFSFIKRAVAKGRRRASGDVFRYLKNHKG